VKRRFVITRDVPASAVTDLAVSPPRSALAAIASDEIVLLPVAVTLEEPIDPALSPRIVRVPDTSPDLAGLDVVLIADDGPQWFRLRSLTLRGVAEAMGDCQYRVVPKRSVSWDYGALREVPTPPDPSSPPPPLFSVPDPMRELQPLDSPALEAAMRASRVMIVASRSRRGTPFAVPLWFVADRDRLYAATSATSWTVRNVAACPRVALMFGGEQRNDPYRLLVPAHARSVRGFPPPPVLAQTTWRYYLQPRFAAVELSHIRLWTRRLRYYLQAEPAHLVITPLSATQYLSPSNGVSRRPSPLN
jgi:hypothetical protein